MRKLALLVAVALVAVIPASFAAPKTPQNPRCVDKTNDALPLTLTVEGEDATGHYALPTEPPNTLIVFAHGYGHTSHSWKQHLSRAAEKGYAAVAMDYRGLEISPDSNDDGLPESRGWPAMTGAEDSLAAALHFERACRGFKTIAIMGVSMGANMAGLAVALAGEQAVTKIDGEPLFDYLFDIEGAVNVIETYMEARMLAPANEFAARAYEDIKAEMGGQDIESDPAPYQERAVVNRVDDIAAANLDGVVVVHGLNDGLVPYNQSREFVPQLVANGIPTEMFTVTTRDGDSEKETTATGYVTDPLTGGQFVAPLAGHASEKSTTHIVMNVAFDELFGTLNGEAIQSYFEYLVYGVFNDANDTEPHYVPEA